MKVMINDLPHEVPQLNGKRFKLNLNRYRNTHHKELAAAKRSFTRWVMTLNLDYKFNVPVTLHYKLTCKNEMDLMNYGAVLDKFLQDGLVKFNMLQDDNVRFVKRIIFDFVGNSKNPTGTLEITPYLEGGE